MRIELDRNFNFTPYDCAQVHLGAFDRKFGGGGGGGGEGVESHYILLVFWYL